MKTICIILIIIVAFLLGYLQRATNLNKVDKAFDRLSQALDFQESIKQETNTLKEEQTKLIEEVRAIRLKTLIICQE